MRGDVMVDFLSLAAHRQAFSAARTSAVANEISRRSGLSHAQLAGQDTNSLVATAIALHHAGQLSVGDVFFIGMQALVGMKESEAALIADDLFCDGAPGEPPYDKKIFDPTPARRDSSPELVRLLRKRGVNAYVITAGLKLLAARGARLFGIPEKSVIGVELETRDGRFTGAYRDVASVGKDLVLKQRIGQPPLFVFGDSPTTDKPMMELALVKSFMVNPKDSFVAQMQQQGFDHMALYY